MAQNNLPSFLSEHLPWEGEVNPIWPASSLTLKRNFASYKFTPKLEEHAAIQLFELVKGALLKIPALAQAATLPADQLSPLEKEFVTEHFLYGGSLQHTGHGQTLIVTPEAKLLILLGIRDHIEFTLLESKGDWEKSWNLLSSLEASLSSSLPLSYTSRFGYLTADPSECGTGLIAQAYLHLPALIHTDQLDDVLAKEKDPEVTAASMEGPIETLIGDLVVLRNSYTLGVSEENILHSLNTSAMRLVVAEKGARNELQKSGSPEMKDKISRAYGLLIHSYQLQTKEALSALSLIKLGVDLGWVAGIADSVLNAAFFKCRKAHLSIPTGSSDPQEIGKNRATFLHKQLAGMVLKTE